MPNVFARRAAYALAAILLVPAGGGALALEDLLPFGEEAPPAADAPLAPLGFRFLEGAEPDFGPRAATPDGKRSWGPEQVLGEPDTEGQGDMATAWASATQDGQDEWLEVEYAEAVEVAKVIVVETYNPGALRRVLGYTDDGMEAELWKGLDPTPSDAGRGESVVPAAGKVRTNRIRIELASSEVVGWNEIDAIGIIDAEGKTHWGVRARASSTYASGAPPEVIIDPRDEELAQLRQENERLRAELERLIQELARLRGQ